MEPIQFKIGTIWTDIQQNSLRIGRGIGQTTRKPTLADLIVA